MPRDGPRQAPASPPVEVGLWCETRPPRWPTDLHPGDTWARQTAPGDYLGNKTTSYVGRSIKFVWISDNKLFWILAPHPSPTWTSQHVFTPPSLPHLDQPAHFHPPHPPPLPASSSSQFTELGDWSFMFSCELCKQNIVDLIRSQRSNCWRG